MSLLENKVVVITGGTGSLGQALTRRLMTGKHGLPRKIIIFSRDEAKQHTMRLQYEKRKTATEDAMYRNFERRLEFRIGDVRSYPSVCGVIKDADIVINAAALKQVPTCEYFPYEAVLTNVQGAQNIVEAIRINGYPVETVIGVSTDKACKPVNVMGMTKALQERIFIAANLTVPETRFICVRYGNVLASRGSVIPLFLEQARTGGPLTLTMPEMTRFLMPMDAAVDTVFAALEGANPGEIYVPKIPAARIMNVADSIISGRDIKIELSGVRPGEKIHENLISDEEAWRTFAEDKYFVIRPMLPEISRPGNNGQPINHEYTSGDSVMTAEETRLLLDSNDLLDIEEKDRGGGL